MQLCRDARVNVEQGAERRHREKPNESQLQGRLSKTPQQGGSYGLPRVPLAPFPLLPGMYSTSGLGARRAGAFSATDTSAFPVSASSLLE